MMKGMLCSTMTSSIRRSVATRSRTSCSRSSTAGFYAGSRLIQQQQRGVRGERAGDLEEAALAVGEVTRQARGEILQADQREQFLRTVMPAGEAAQARGAQRFWPRGEQDVVEACLLRQHAAFLECARNSEARAAMRGQPVDACSGEADFAGIGALPAGDQVEQRRLAGAVGADQADDAGTVQRERNAVNGADTAEGAADILQFKHAATDARSRRCRPGRAACTAR